MANDILIAPSVLKADFLNYAEEISKINNSGADLIHLDVMDGNFVPRISFGDPIIEATVKASKLPVEVHFMTEKPEQYILSCKDAGVETVIIHWEAASHIHRTLQEIKKQGMKAGVAINPGTPINVLKDLLELCDVALIMTVNPGWGGQKFIESSLGRISELSEIIKSNPKLNTKIEVDGGVNESTAKACIEAGASMLVAGSFITDSGDYSVAVEKLRGD